MSIKTLYDPQAVQMPQKLFPQRILKLYIRIMQIMSPLYGELILIIRIPNETNKISSENY